MPAENLEDQDGEHATVAARYRQRHEVLDMATDRTMRSAPAGALGRPRPVRTAGRRGDREHVAVDDGTSLLEMLIAMMLLAVVLAGVAGTMGMSLQTIAKNERLTNVTALETQTIEELQALEWHAVALYENDLAAVSEYLGPDNTFEGARLVTVAGPSSDHERDARLPRPVRTFERERVQYTVRTFIVWADRNGDGRNETKHLIALVSWPDLDGEVHTSRLDADRTPVERHAKGEDEPRLLQFSVSPDPGRLDSEGHAITTLDVLARFDDEVAGVTVAYPVVTATYDDDGQLVSATLTQRTLHLAPIDAGITWTGSVNQGGERYASGDNPWNLTATSATSTLTGSESVTFVGGPFSHAELSGQTAPAPSPTPTAPAQAIPEEDVAITQWLVRPNPLCVDNSGRLASTITLDVSTTGLIDADGVQVTYPYWSADNRSAVPDLVATEAAEFVSGDSAHAVFRLHIDTDADRHFKRGQSVTFTIRAERFADASNSQKITPTYQVSRC